MYSLLGHGPSQKRRTGTSQTNQAALSKRLLDEGLRTQVNDVSSRKILVAPSSIMSGVSSESHRVVPARSRSVSTVSESGSRKSKARRQPLATPRPTPTPPLLKRDSSISTVLYRSSQDTEADWSSAVSHIDEVESDSSQSRMSAMRSRESSVTPPITSMAQAMSISGYGQLASLLAEKEMHQRIYSAPASLSPGVPPPPPPPPLFPQTPSSKMRTPPVNEATRSMAMVLNELSTSKVQLRKTDSPFLSRISSAIDSSPNSKFSRVVFKSRLDMISDKYSGNSTRGSTAPLSLVSHLRGPSNGTNLNGSASPLLDKVKLETPVKRGIQPGFQEPGVEREEEELTWPSPGTVRQADSRLEVAAKDLSRKQDGKEQGAVISRSSGELKTKRAEDKADYGTPKAHNLVEGKRKWTSRTSYTTEAESREVTPATATNGSNAGAESEDMTSLSSGGLSTESSIFGRERSGPRLDDNNTRPRRPARPRSMVLSRSMTDPTTLHSSGGVSTATPTMTIADKEKERQWFLESDMDGWKVAQ
ncbi:hypothetical protein BGZ95_001401 [Linnemannia exigua]|uniref:Uncharacterized protein n=1 Tax=Linnemannia exigua TaxID=604196 RepID=A0AAD4D6X6_9FUNG|nr:hypothetical protein BGZ95_001401 [Linnemannia exigua]